MQLGVFSEVLDRAITDVANQEYRRLLEGASPPDLGEKVRLALNSFGGLRGGRPPDYQDPWVALLYLTWFQAGQIQLAYKHIRLMNEKRSLSGLTLNNKTPLRVLDFGCGAMAMRFALAWMAAEVLESGRSIPVIYFYGIDPSRYMTSLGERLWERTTEEIEGKPGLKRFSASMKAVQFRSDLAALSHRQNLRDERWLSAVHVLYKTNVPYVKDELSLLLKQFAPDVGLLTSHDDPESRSRLDSVSPFEDSEYDASGFELRSESELDLPEVTNWRKELNAQISPTHRCLENSVNWTFRESFGLTYIKKG